MKLKEKLANDWLLEEIRIKWAPSSYYSFIAGFEAACKQCERADISECFYVDLSDTGPEPVSDRSEDK